MQVVNFDFSAERPIEKLLMVGLPAALAQAISYPALRLQALVLGRPWQTQSAVRELQYHTKILTTGQLYRGIRYALDHTLTYVTVRYLLFEWFVSLRQDISRWWIHTCVLGSTVAATVIGHPSFLYRTMAASDVSPVLRPEELKIKLKRVGQTNILRVGIRESLAINCISALLDVEAFFRLREYLKVGSDFGDILPAALATIPSTILLHPLHKYRHTVIQNQYERTAIRHVWNFDGLVTSLLRRTVMNTLLFSMYTSVLHYRMKYQIEGMYAKRQLHQNVRATQEGASRQEQQLQAKYEKADKQPIQALPPSN